MVKPLKNAHTSNSKYGMGDHYGSGIRNKVGRIRDVHSINSDAKKQLVSKKTSMA